MISISIITYLIFFGLLILSAVIMENAFVITATAVCSSRPQKRSCMDPIRSEDERCHLILTVIQLRSVIRRGSSASKIT